MLLTESVFGKHDNLKQVSFTGFKDSNRDRDTEE